MDAKPARWLLFPLFLFCSAADLPAQVAATDPHIVKDINPGSESSIKEDQNILVAGKLVYFVACGADSNYHLWATDGSENGTVMLTDAPGASFGRLVAGKDDLVFFPHNDGVHGVELWTTNGTVTGTRMLVDLSPGSVNGVRDDLIRLGDRICFFTVGDGLNYSLCSTDGKAAGMRTISTFPISMKINLAGVVEGHLYFFKITSPRYGQTELWRTDGTVAGTTLVKKMGSIITLNRADDLLTTIGQKIFFPIEAIWSPGNHHRNQIWQTDGTAGGTFMVEALTYFSRMAGLNGKLYYLADAAGSMSHDFSLKSYNPADSSSREIIELTDVPKDGAAPYFFTFKDSLLVLTENGLWGSDGTTSGTYLITKVNTMNLDNYSPYYLQVNGSNDRWIFSGGESPGIFDFWQTDSTAAGTRRLGPTGLDPDSQPQRLVQCGDFLFYTGLEKHTGMELWTMSLKPLYSAAHAWNGYR